jgi:PTS hybrid protein
VRAAIGRAGRDGDGVVVLGDLGSSILTVRAVLDEDPDDDVCLVDAPFVEGAVTAAVAAGAGATLAEVVQAAQEARGVAKL